mmetsp:Transcript_70456/g.127028  ORF Transcript_70456/g.127028 Transcript_70456/m.127028 type:complete len:239 (+) Transcript_70456:693-1409(+)
MLPALRIESLQFHLPWSGMARNQIGLSCPAYSSPKQSRKNFRSCFSSHFRGTLPTKRVRASRSKFSSGVGFCFLFLGRGGADDEEVPAAASAAGASTAPAPGFPSAVVRARFGRGVRAASATAAALLNASSDEDLEGLAERKRLLPLPSAKSFVKRSDNSADSGSFLDEALLPAIASNPFRMTSDTDPSPPLSATAFARNVSACFSFQSFCCSPGASGALLLVLAMSIANPQKLVDWA